MPTTVPNWGWAAGQAPPEGGREPGALGTAGTGPTQVNPQQEGGPGDTEMQGGSSRFSHYRLKIRGCGLLSHSKGHRGKDLGEGEPRSAEVAWSGIL
jgi:hypothetical protein